MTKQKSFKDKIRTRMDKTGESYATARRRLIEKSDAEALKKRTPKSISAQRTNDAAVLENTGKKSDQWFKILDKWDAKSKNHTQIARYLTDEQEVPGWWAQHLTVAYEQARGMRAPGQRADGTYSVSASKTANASLDEVFAAVQDDDARSRWLGDYAVKVRTVRAGKSITAAWEDGSRLMFWFDAKGAGKTQFGVAHERIGEARQADEMKGFWRERLGSLKKLLES